MRIREALNLFRKSNEPSLKKMARLRFWESSRSNPFLTNQRPEASRQYYIGAIGRSRLSDSSQTGHLKSRQARQVSYVIVTFSLMANADELN